MSGLCSPISVAVIIYFLEGRGVGDTHITGRHIGGGTHITSDMCAGIHISRGYTYHCDRLRHVVTCFDFMYATLKLPPVDCDQWVEREGPGRNTSYQYLLGDFKNGERSWLSMQKPFFS